MLVRPGFEPATSRSADRRSPNWANQAAVKLYRKWSEGKRKLLRVSGRFELTGVDCIINKDNIILRPKKENEKQNISAPLQIRSPSGLRKFDKRPEGAVCIHVQLLKFPCLTGFLTGFIYTSNWTSVGTVNGTMQFSLQPVLFPDSFLTVEGKRLVVKVRIITVYK